MSAPTQPAEPSKELKLLCDDIANNLRVRYLNASPYIAQKICAHVAAQTAELTARLAKTEELRFGADATRRQQRHELAELRERNEKLTRWIVNHCDHWSGDHACGDWDRLLKQQIAEAKTHTP